MEIYALEMQLATHQKDLKQVRKTFEKAMAVRGGIPHPRTLALIQELGGKMFMASKEYESASTTFFQAFKSYDEAGDPSRLKCLKYLVMASMLHASTINPFDSQEARPCKLHALSIHVQLELFPHVVSHLFLFTKYFKLRQGCSRNCCHDESRFCLSQ